MKKLLAIMLLLVITLTGCSSEKVVQLTEGSQQRGEESTRIFDSWSCKTDFAKYVIEQSEDMTQDEASALVKKIEEDADKVDAYFGSTTDKMPTIYVVQKDVFSGKELQYEYALGNALYISTEEVNNGDYLGMLIHMTRDLPQLWMCYGIAGDIHDTSDDSQALEKFYSDEHNLETLLLSDMRFIQTIALENTAIAKETAVSFWKSLKHEKNIEDYCTKLASEDLSTEKNAWLKSIHVDLKYESPYEGFMGAVKANYTREYDLYATTPDAEFYINRGEGGGGIMETSPYYLERIFYNNMMGLAQVKAYFKKENALDIFPCDDKLTYYFKVMGETSGGSVGVVPTQRIIELYGQTQDLRHIHEAIHVYTIHGSGDKESGVLSLAEGFATYMEDTVSKEYAGEYLSIKDGQYRSVDAQYQYVMYDPELITVDGVKEQIEVYQAPREYYLEHGGKLDDQEEFDGFLYADAFTYVNYTKLMKAEPGSEEEGMLINAYSYYFDESFFHYLTDEYSFRKVCQLFEGVQHGESYESIMGKTFDELVAEWLAKVGVN